MVEVTLRAIHGRFLLRPTPGLRELLAGIFARAKNLYAVRIHGVVALGNHLHALLSPRDAQQLARFMGYVATNISKEAGRLHNWRGTLFERRYQAILVSDEPAAQINRLRYLLEQGCKEGLVWSPTDWPGLHCAQALIDATPIAGTWIDRTAQWSARQRREDASAHSHTTTHPLSFDPLPCWAHDDPERVQRRIRAMVEDIEEQTRRRHAKDGTQPLGKRGILRQDPHATPSKVAWCRRAR
jgi:REP element-mobilizing transposase RayT